MITKMLFFTLQRNSGIGSVMLTYQECTLGHLIGQHSALSDGVEARVEPGSTFFGRRHSITFSLPKTLWIKTPTVPIQWSH